MTDFAIAKRRLGENLIDVPAMHTHAIEMLRPVDEHWLADRLKGLWKSTIPAGSLAAKDWLRETGRIIKHLPLDIVAHAIDEAIKRSERGFTPVAGEIIAIAKPLIAERRRVAARLGHIVNGMPPLHNEPTVAPEDRCTPEQAREILAKFGMRSAFEPDSKPRARDMHVPSAEELEQVARDFKAQQ